MKMLLAGLLIAVSVAGCVPRQQTASIDPTPYMNLEQAKTYLVSRKRELFVDPASVMDASISYPYPTPRARNTICLHVNARNRMGGYQGMTELLIFIKPDGSFESHQVTQNYDRCERLMFPFPELTR